MESFLTLTPGEPLGPTEPADQQRLQSSRQSQILPWLMLLEAAKCLLDGLSEKASRFESGGRRNGARLYPTKPNDRI